MKIVNLLPACLILATAVPALAASRTVTLIVSGMTCSMCPITVKKALKAVSGVSKVDVSFAKKEAVVTFDDAKTNVPALTKATADVGYPSVPEGKAK